MSKASKYPRIEKLGLTIGGGYQGIVNADDLEALLEKAVKVWGNVGSEASSWTSHPHGTFVQENYTHSALLLSITPLKPKCEKHVPTIESKQVSMPQSKDPFGAALLLGCAIVCATCGVRLEAEWKEAGEV